MDNLLKVYSFHKESLNNWDRNKYNRGMTIKLVIQVNELIGENGMNLIGYDESVLRPSLSQKSSLHESIIKSPLHPTH